MKGTPGMHNTENKAEQNNMNVEGEDGYLQIKDRGLRRNHTCWHLDLEMLPPELWKN